MSTEPIRVLLAQAFPDAVEIGVEDRTGGGDHFQVTVTSPSFDGLPLIEQHRLGKAAPAAPAARPRGHEPRKRKKKKEGGEGEGTGGEKKEKTEKGGGGPFFMKGTP